MSDAETGLWYKISGVLLAVMGMLWGNHRYTNNRIDKLNTAVGEDVGKVKENISECEKATLLLTSEIKDIFSTKGDCKEDREQVEKLIGKVEVTIAEGHKAIFEELKYLRRKRGGVNEQ